MSLFGSAKHWHGVVTVGEVGVSFLVEAVECWRDCALFERSPDCSPTWEGRVSSQEAAFLSAEALHQRILTRLGEMVAKAARAIVHEPPASPVPPAVCARTVEDAQRAFVARMMQAMEQTVFAGPPAPVVPPVPLPPPDPVQVAPVLDALIAETREPGWGRLEPEGRG